MKNSALLGVAGAILAIGCGSDSTPGPSGGAGGQAAGGTQATGGSGGSDPSGTGGVGGSPGGSCTYDGQTYADGSSFPATDGCNTCSCSSGVVACTLMACETAGTGDCAGQPCGAQACTIEVECFVPPCLPVDGYCDTNGQCVEVPPSC